MENIDFKMVIESFTDETEGFEEYKDKASKTTDEGLKNLFLELAETEKNHAKALLSYVNAHAQKVLV